MLKKYTRGDVLAISVVDSKISLAQIVEELNGNVLLVVFSELLGADDSFVMSSLDRDEPIFLVETMDERIKDGTWPIVGNRGILEHPTPVYKVWVEPPGEFWTQDIHGNLGHAISLEKAAKMKRHKTFSPAVVEAGLRGFHGLGPWLPGLDELIF